MEKEIWKWILDTFTDEGIANIALSFGIKIPGFRQINPQLKNFKIVRPRIIQEALHQRNAQNLNDFFSVAAEDNDMESLRGKSFEELLKLAEEEIHPSILLGVLLSGEDNKDQANAHEIYIKLKDEEKLDMLERQADEKMKNEETFDEDSFNHLQNELDTTKQKLEKLEKKLKKFEEKNEELKAQEALTLAAFKKEKKQWKTEKKELQQEIQTLKAEQGNFKSKAASAQQVKEDLQKKFDHQVDLLKKKEDEIKRLNALVLKLNTDLDKFANLKVPVYQGGKIKVAMVGDPQNKRLHQYNRFELSILAGSEIEEEQNHQVLDRSDQVWLLTYKTPRSIQKRVKSIFKQKKMKEFATFNDLENYMLKGMF